MNKLPCNMTLCINHRNGVCLLNDRLINASGACAYCYLGAHVPNDARNHLQSKRDSFLKRWHTATRRFEG